MNSNHTFLSALTTELLRSNEKIVTNYIKYVKSVPAITTSDNTGDVSFTCHFQIQVF